ncbi:hypothetical protein PAXRUDRAFT_149576 [Paxillus rubicundulus Ve08.2h10]|uniref:Uncharacterized protein n=1 Tax=Paxillus rubicundulus Ve08.2h10 TaxID=930991 RepID=A0A0D0DY30_9AGAM|nr:hypothetical protein PAXRUDRAFT_149576 [Paxillus rubicundulus Ve08.2h10]
MCLESCVGFTGPFADLKTCPVSSCRVSRWDPGRLRASNGHVKVAAKKFTTIPLGPQLQAQFCDPHSAHAMHYLYEHTQEIIMHLRETGEIPVIDDIAMGLHYLSPVLDGDIKENDIFLMVSLNGVQLYEHKDSDCWMYVWIIVNLAPDQRYQKIHVRHGRFIPGPNKPKNLDSFLCIGVHHVTALQKEGLKIWDADCNLVFRSNLYLLFPTADGPGLVYWDGMVGHSGKNGCRIYCGVISH